MNNSTGRPLVSVLLPVYNGQRYLAAALKSVLTQSFGDFECLVLDDGSIDGSGEIALAFARQDARVRVIRRENRGLVSTLNELVGASRGDLIARMDADDIALADRFARQVAFMAEHSEVVCVGGGHWIIDEEDRTIAQIRQPADDEGIQSLALRGHTTICHPAAMIRASALRRIGGYRQAYYPTEDLDLWLRLGEVGRLANLTVPVIRYRFHSGSISGGAAQGRQRDAARRTCQDAWVRRGLLDVKFEAIEPWRPTEDRDSRLTFALQYGWMAYDSGFRETALVYGVKALKINCFRLGGWGLVIKALLKFSLKKNDS